MHIPVLTKEVLQYLDPKENENFVDCTVGQGGHTILILEKTSPKGKVLGIDLDSQQIASLRDVSQSEKKFKDRLILVNDSYINIKKIIEKENFNSINGILLDLGMSSEQLEKSGKGFSFLRDEPLDMRFSDRTDLTAEIIINEWPEERIEEVLREYGEEKFSKKITKSIVEERKRGRIKSAFQLAEAIKDATPSIYWTARIHYATRTFQALRIAVNDELENLKKVLPQAISVLSSGGRMAIISFHSLEDRIVKKFLKEMEKIAFANASAGKVKILTKKPIIASDEEIKLNSRSRSAKLRAFIKI